MTREQLIEELNDAIAALVTKFRQPDHHLAMADIVDCLESATNAAEESGEE